MKSGQYRDQLAPMKKKNKRRGAMGTFHVRCKIENHVDRSKSVIVPKLLVDTGSDYTWIPARLNGARSDQMTVSCYQLYQLIEIISRRDVTSTTTPPAVLSSVTDNPCVVAGFANL